jgi:MYXO-CTERM domain-containing protein
VSGATWSTAPHAASGTITVTGNATYTTTATNLALANCYSYTETLAATTDSAAVTSSAGLLAETTNVPPAPTVTTATSDALVYPHTAVSDSVTVTGIGGYTGTLAWALVGPVNPVTAGTCAGVNWSTAPGTPVGQGNIAVSTDGTVSSGPVTVDVVGCYSWTDSLTGTFPGTATIAAGATDEVVLVQPHQPVLTTAAVLTAGTGGTQSVTDTVDVNNSGIATSGGSPSSAPLTWTLSGPVAPVANVCAAVSWTGSPTVDTGVITVTGDGAYVTPSDALTATGCYSYTETLAATADSLLSTSTLGGPTETILLLAPPTMVTAAAETGVFPYTSVTDTVTVTGTTGQPGVVMWSLVGPVAEAADGTCDGVSWSGATVQASGLTTVTADGDATTGPVPVDGVGCYGWTDEFTGANFLGQTQVPAGAANEVIQVTPFQPVITTHATLANGRFFDNVTVSGSGIGTAPDAPTSAVLTWTLLGPATSASGDCASVTWAGQPTLAGGTMTVISDGIYQTPSTRLARPGCYTFFEGLSGTTEGDEVSTDPGVDVETHAMLASDFAADGLGAIGTDLGRWSPDSGAEGSPPAPTLALALLGLSGLALVRRRRRRRA